MKKKNKTSKKKLKSVISLSDNKDFLQIKIRLADVIEFARIPNTKIDSSVTEDALLQTIIDRDQIEWTNAGLAEAMEDNGFHSYTWQTAKNDLKKFRYNQVDRP